MTAEGVKRCCSRDQRAHMRRFSQGFTENSPRAPFIGSTTPAAGKDSRTRGQYRTEMIISIGGLVPQTAIIRIGLNGSNSIGELPCLSIARKHNSSKQSNAEHFLEDILVSTPVEFTRILLSAHVPSLV